ncbi:MAG TPA: hypothetical protein VMK12_24165 [Anaeromyxobacteraceae bacterium]|nr:hypothetical protein [Anaeromyxobacteraceae bacterium]
MNHSTDGTLSEARASRASEGMAAWRNWLARASSSNGEPIGGRPLHLALGASLELGAGTE